MHENLVKIVLKNFTSVRNWEIDSEIPNNCLLEAVNCEFDGGVWKSIQGTTSWLSQLTGGTVINGLIYYPYKKDDSTATEYLVQYYDKKFYLIDTEAETRTLVAGTTFTADEEISGANYNNDIYFISPVNSMGYILDGGTWGNTFTGTPPIGTMLETAFEKLWSAGVPTNRNLITYSRSATASNPEFIRDYTTGSGSILIGSGGAITAIRRLKDTMYVFKEDSIYYLKGFDTSGTYPIPLFDPYTVTGGAINQKCVTQVENDLWFLNRSLQLRSLGSVAQYISDTRTNDVSLAIKRYLNELDPDQPRAAMNYFKNVLKVSLRTAGSTYNNFVLTYDFNNGGYSVERLHPIKLYANTPSQRYFCEDGADSLGYIFKDSVGYSKNGAAFSFSGKTKMVNLGKSTINGRLRYIKIYCGRSEGQELNLSVYADSYNNAVSSGKILAMPTSAEMGTATTTGGGFGEEGFGEEMFGGSGNLKVSAAPTVYRKVFPVDQNLTGRMFGVEISGTINGTRAEIYEIELGIIQLPDKNIYVTN
jgi:hypothetical protein